ncbi:MAG: hypothetical protein H7840_04655 [Alphaproteobacteria bacterium]
MNQRGNLTDRFDRLPLVAKVAAGLVLVSTALWAILDPLQTTLLRGILDDEIGRRLDERAVGDRHRFHQALESHAALLRLQVRQRDVVSHLLKHHANSPEWDNPSGPVVPNVTSGLPTWLAPRSVLRAFSVPQVLAVMDRNDRLREIYVSHGSVPSQLHQLDRRILAMSDGQTLLTTLDGRPYVITSTQAVDERGDVIARLMAVSSLDRRFLQEAGGVFLRGPYVVALIGGSPPEVLASSSPAQLPEGSRFDAIERSHMVSGRSALFFDYGSSDLKATFVTLLPRSEADTLTAPIVAMDRLLRAAMAGGVALAVVLAVALSAARRRRLAHQTPATPVDAEPEAPEAGSNGRSAAEEQLDILRTLTESLGIGLIRLAVDGSRPDNTVMERLVRECRGIAVFVSALDGSGEARVVDTAGTLRRFEVTQPPGLDTGLALVHDVTSRHDTERNARASGF